MLAFILRRIAQSLLVMVTVALIAFVMFRFVGDPVNQMVGVDTPQAEVARLRESLGLNDSTIVQFGRFLWNALHFEFGTSYQFRLPVTQLLGERAPATLELALVASLFALIVGVVMGVYCALRPNGILARLFQAISLVGVSLPTFLIGILLIYVFAVTLGWLPSNGRGQVVKLGRWWTTGFFTASGLRALILPAITLGLFQMTLIMRLVRAEMMEVMRTDYVKFARARGIRTRSIHFRHALKNTLIPVITIAGLQLGSIIAFAIITETVFNWPGMGLLFLKAVQNVDIPIMAAYLMLIGLLFVTINLIVDLAYGLVDPRLRVAMRS